MWAHRQSKLKEVGGQRTSVTSCGLARKATPALTCSYLVATAQEQLLFLYFCSSTLMAGHVLEEEGRLCLVQRGGVKVLLPVATPGVTNAVSSKTYQLVSPTFPKCLPFFSGSYSSILSAHSVSFPQLLP